MIVAEYRRDLRFRAGMMLYVNLAVNCAFALFDAVFARVQGSPWLGTLAFYYIALSLMRFVILRGHRRGNDERGWRIYRGCGLAMLTLTITLTGMYALTASGAHTIVYPWYFIYAVAAYTFYAAISAVRNVIIYRRLNNPFFSASKAINLVVAAISVFSLQSAMISAFGSDEAFRVLMGNCVGIGVLVVIVAISLLMIVRGNRTLKHAD